jgi:hypothetical protein
MADPIPVWIWNAFKNARQVWSVWSGISINAITMVWYHHEHHASHHQSGSDASG